MMKAYVGAAKSAPAWRTPRRLPASSKAITPMPAGTAAGVRDGMADVTAATPEETDTATVMM